MHQWRNSTGFTIIADEILSKRWLYIDWKTKLLESVSDAQGSRQVADKESKANFLDVNHVDVLDLLATARLDGVLVPEDFNDLILSYVMPAVASSLSIQLTCRPSWSCPFFSFMALPE